MVFKRSGNEAFAMVVDNDGNIIEIEERIDDRATFSYVRLITHVFMNVYSVSMLSVTIF